MIEKTEYVECFISGKSAQISRDEGIVSDFDLFIFSCGWESRGTFVINFDKGCFKFDSAMVLSFNLGDTLGYKIEYLDRIKSFIKNKKNCSHVFFVEHEPIELEDIFRDIREILEKLIKIRGRPLNIGFDITCCPRFVFLYLLGYCLRNSIIKNISFFYSEGIYDTNPEEYVHTKGHWKIIEIPELEARDYKLNKRLFVVSAGWEGSRYRSLISKYEPDMIGILLPNPGFTKKYTKKSEKESKPLIEDYHINEDSVVSAPAGDAIAAWKALNSHSLNRADYHIAYLTFGPKPHALGMGVRGFLHDSISVIYRIPNEYIMIEAKPNGIFWRYDFRNLLVI